MPVRTRWSLLIPLAALLACAAPNREVAPAPASAPAAGLDLAGIDRAVKPGDDFFAYANGAWVKATVIPPERASIGVFSLVEERTSKRIAELIEQAAAAEAPASADARKIGDIFASFMDEAGIEARGLAPLQPELDRIAAISDRESLARYLGTTLRADVDVLNDTHLATDRLFGLWVAQDLDDPTRYSPFLLQGGLGMPDRDYYLNASPRMADIRKAYINYISTLLRLSGAANADEAAARVMELETKIARVHASRTDSEDVEKGNNHWTRAQLDSKAPGIDWKPFLEAARLESQSTFVIWQPGAFSGLSALAQSEPLSLWKEYLRVRALDRSTHLLPKAFLDAAFEFYGTKLAGTLKLRERWKRAVDVVSAEMGMAVGKLYVEKYFPPGEKARAEQMVRDELAAFAKRIDALEWMAPQTKEKAKAKLKALKVGVGYPDQWRDYSGLVVIRGDAFGNEERAKLYEYDRNLKKFGQPVDRGEWAMNPQLVNAVNLPAMNALNFPAAILQPPDFDPDRPAAMNYGAAGAIIGHEISHSFDDQGALFDATGKLANWWTPEDFAHFKASSEALIKQYDGYRPFPDLAVNGRQTISENIADVAGLAAAYDAYQMSLNGKAAPEVQGLTGDQQFYLSFAQSWRNKSREPAMRQRIVTDGHAPPEYRADTVRNQDAWYAAFNVQPGEKLYLPPEQRVRVW